MPYPDGMSHAALDHETSSRPSVARRELSADEETVLGLLLSIGRTISTFADFTDLTPEIFQKGSDAASYRKSIILDGLGYIQYLRSAIRAIPEHEALAEERRLTEEGYP